jgi:hypothetical protein
VAPAGAHENVYLDAVFGASTDGTIVESRGVDPNAPSETHLFVSRDGTFTWEPIKTAGGCEEGTEIVGPSTQGLDDWVVLDDQQLCKSRDLQS